MKADNSVSYCITVCTEKSEFFSLIEQISKILNEDDEVIVLQDENSPEDLRSEIKSFFVKKIQNDQAQYLLRKFENDFADHKNFLIEKARKKWVFQIDADELLSNYLAKNIKTILKLNSRYDMLGLPRKNTLSPLPSFREIKQWHWRVDSKERINWPDHQFRIFRNHRNYKFESAVHERVVGANLIKALGASERFCILHHKSLKKQQTQNEFYEELEAKGSQNEDGN